MDRLRKTLFFKLGCFKMVRNGFLGRLGRCSEGHLGALGPLFGRSWEALGALLGARDALLQRFGRSWERTFEATSLQHRASQHQVPNLDELVTILG